VNTSWPDRVDGLLTGVYQNMWTAPLHWPSPTLISRLGRRCVTSAPAPVPASEALTICFLDLEGFTAYTSREGDGAAEAVLSEHRRTVERIVRASSGRVVQHVGDGTVLAFGDAANAVDAALAIVGSEDGPLRVRAGLHTGTVLVLPDGDVLGQVVNVAARVAAATDGGEVVVTTDTADAAANDPRVVYVRPQRRRFKGIDGLVQTRRVVNGRPALHLQAA
jgi:adenylate cyclase